MRKREREREGGESEEASSLLRSHVHFPISSSPKLTGREGEGGREEAREGEEGAMISLCGVGCSSIHAPHFFSSNAII